MCGLCVTLRVKSHLADATDRGICPRWWFDGSLNPPFFLSLPSWCAPQWGQKRSLLAQCAKGGLQMTMPSCRGSGGYGNCRGGRMREFAEWNEWPALRSHTLSLSPLFGFPPLPSSSLDPNISGGAFQTSATCQEQASSLRVKRGGGRELRKGDLITRLVDPTRPSL